MPVDWLMTKILMRRYDTVAFQDFPRPGVSARLPGFLTRVFTLAIVGLASHRTPLRCPTNTRRRGVEHQLIRGRCSGRFASKRFEWRLRSPSRKNRTARWGHAEGTVWNSGRGNGSRGECRRAARHSAGR
jgi:hypothetical protein